VSSGLGKPPAAERIYHETVGYWYRTVWIGDRYHLHRSGGDGPDVCLGEVDWPPPAPSETAQTDVS
jgi:hypothetical protein